MVTFTLPCEFRSMVYQNQRAVYSLMFSCISDTLKDFGLNPRHLGAQIGMTMVLHTHSRRLDFHLHVHVVVPAGGIDSSRRQWKKKKGKYLFNQQAMARVFRARFLNGRVTFRYIEGESKEICHRTLKGEDFLRLILRHVLPRGFRRARDYGFLHSNAKKLLFLVQLILHVRIMAMARHPRPAFKCSHCGSLMIVVGVRQATYRSG